MMSFWVGLAGGAAVLSLCLAVAWWRAPTVRYAMQQGAEEFDNVQGYRVERDALTKAVSRGELNAFEYESYMRQLDRRLLADTTHQDAQAPRTVHAGWRSLVVILLIGSGLIGAGYGHWGAAGDIRLFECWRTVADSGHATPQAYLDSLESEVARQPNNPHLWAMLWPLYRDVQRFDDAKRALARQMALTGTSVEGLAEQAQLSYFAAGRQVTPEVAALCQHVLEKAPQQPTIHAMLGFDAFLKGDNLEAIRQWQQALEGGADKDGTANALREGIAAAQARLKAEARPARDH